MKKATKALFTFVLVLALSMGSCFTVFAHALNIESLGGTYVHFAYSDGTDVKGAKIIVQDANGDTIGTGKTNSKGVYNYAEFEGKAAKLIMNDGEGHVGEYEVPAETPPVTDKTPVETTKAEEQGTAAATEAATQAAQAETQAAETTSAGGMDTGTIATIVLVVAALAAVAVLFAKRSKKS